MKLFLVRALFSAVLVFAFFVSAQSWAQSAPNVPEQYKRLFFEYSDRHLLEKMLNPLGLTTLKVGRSYALIAGVTQYPNFPVQDRSLKPAAVDIEKLKSYLRDQEYFDEIVVLKDGDMNLDNLNYFLETYFPRQLARSPHSRFLFAYSGHGYAEGAEASQRGFLLTSSATSKTDPENSIELGLLRKMLDPVIDSAEKVLVLVNACHSGAFLGRRTFGGPNPMGLGDRGAHAIMASRSSQESLALDRVGPGSVFFEKIFEGLGGVADTDPRDGVVTYHELVNFLRKEVPYVTNNAQIPLEGDISWPKVSEGEFFFLNRSRQVQLGNAQPWNPGDAVKFGVEDSDSMEKGRAAFAAGQFDQAFRAYQQAAAAGNAEGMTQLGYLYFAGNGVARDYQLARRWFEAGAAAGNATAMANLGVFYREGFGVGQDYLQARQWFEKAAASGDSAGMNGLGGLYFAGLGVAQDYVQARAWYEKAAAAGWGLAMANLGGVYRDGIGVPQDYQQARSWYQKAAAAGDPAGMTALGGLYLIGRGVAQDYQQARQWFEKAVAAGDPTAMDGLGYLYREGLGVAQDYRQARQWYERAAAAGDAAAMDNLGFLYQYGYGVAQDYPHARQWYEKAAAAGDKDAPERLKALPQ
ncbi:MAG: caspase family protein [Candidatus Sulfotelmatobacter sp.]